MTDYEPLVKNLRSCAESLWKITCHQCGYDKFVVSLILKDDGETIITDTKNKAIEAWNRRAKT